MRLHIARWIKIENELPQENEKVLFFDEDTEDIFLGFEWRNKFYADGINDEWQCNTPSHWMRLPDNPTNI